MMHWTEWGQGKIVSFQKLDLLFILFKQILVFRPVNTVGPDGGWPGKYPLCVRAFDSAS